MRLRAIFLLLKILQGVDRLRLRWLQARHPGLHVHSGASTNFAMARFDLQPGAELSIGDGATTERRRDGVRFVIEAGARVTVGEGVWLRSDIQPVHLVAFAGGCIELGPRSFLNGSHISAKERVTLGERAFIGPGTRIFDSDQHDFDAEHLECPQPVTVGDHSWIASDVTVLRGVEIGAHCVIGARAVVTRSIPAHRVAIGAPAQPRGAVGDRSAAR